MSYLDHRPNQSRGADSGRSPIHFTVKEAQRQTSSTWLLLQNSSTGSFSTPDLPEVVGLWRKVKLPPSSSQGTEKRSEAQKHKTHGLPQHFFNSLICFPASDGPGLTCFPPHGTAACWQSRLNKDKNKSRWCGEGKW